MRHQKRPLLLLIIGIFSLLALAGLIYFFPPDTAFTLSQILPNLSFPLEKFIQVSIIILFFLLLAIFLFSLCSYAFKSKAHGVLIASFFVIYFLFRLNHLTNPFFLILLIALFVTLELFVSNKK